MVVISRHDDFVMMVVRFRGRRATMNVDVLVLDVASVMRCAALWRVAVEPPLRHRVQLLVVSPVTLTLCELAEPMERCYITHLGQAMCTHSVVLRAPRGIRKG